MSRRLRERAGVGVTIVLRFYVGASAVAAGGTCPRRRAPRRLLDVLPIDAARANALKTDWDNLAIPVPWFIGRRFARPTMADLLPHLNWVPFFAAHDLAGPFPALLEHPVHGARARALHDRARWVLAELAKVSAFAPHGAYGFWPANSVDDDILVYKDDARASVLVRLHALRQQQIPDEGQPSLSVADFVAPKASFAPDYIGAYALSLGIDLDGRDDEGLSDEDRRLVAALVAQLTAAFAQFVHAQVRRDWAGTDKAPQPSDDRHPARDVGLRAAIGGPVCPDRSEREAICRLLHTPEIGLAVTDTFALAPGASEVGLFFAHPQAAPFTLGPIGPDQLADLAARKGVSVEQAERWLV